MSTDAREDVEPTAAQDDPWRYGWRYVKKVGPDGQEFLDQVPLTLEDVLYPEEGDFRVETPAHQDDCYYLYGTLRKHLREREDALVLCDCRVDWGVAGVRALGPDVVVFFGVSGEVDRDAGTFRVADYGATPVLLIEVTSPSTRMNDVGRKMDLYWRAGVRSYAIADVIREGGGRREIELRAYRAGPDRFLPVEPDGHGRIRLEPVALWLTHVADGRIAQVALEDATGHRFPSDQELIAEYRRQMEQARIERERAEELLRMNEEEIRLRQEAQRYGAEQARLREEAEGSIAEQTRLREEAERRAANADRLQAEAQVELQRLRAELERLRGPSA